MEERREGVEERRTAVALAISSLIGTGSLFASFALFVQSSTRNLAFDWKMGTRAYITVSKGREEGERTREEEERWRGEDGRGEEGRRRGGRWRREERGGDTFKCLWAKAGEMMALWCLCNSSFTCVTSPVHIQEERKINNN